MDEPIKQEIQTVHIPTTGETKQAKTYSGKELLLREQGDEKDEAYSRLWEDDRL